MSPNPVLTYEAQCEIYRKIFGEIHSLPEIIDDVLVQNSFDRYRFYTGSKLAKEANESILKCTDSRPKLKYNMSPEIYWSTLFRWPCPRRRSSMSRMTGFHKPPHSTCSTVGGFERAWEGQHSVAEAVVMAKYRKPFSSVSCIGIPSENFHHSRDPQEDLRMIHWRRHKQVESPLPWNDDIGWKGEDEKLHWRFQEEVDSQKQCKDKEVVWRHPEEPNTEYLVFQNCSETQHPLEDQQLTLHYWEHSDEEIDCTVEEVIIAKRKSKPRFRFDSDRNHAFSDGEDSPGSVFSDDDEGYSPMTAFQQDSLEDSPDSGTGPSPISLEESSSQKSNDTESDEGIQIRDDPPCNESSIQVNTNSSNPWNQGISPGEKLVWKMRFNLKEKKITCNEFRVKSPLKEAHCNSTPIEVHEKFPEISTFLPGKNHGPRDMILLEKNYDNMIIDENIEEDVLVVGLAEEEMEF